MSSPKKPGKPRQRAVSVAEVAAGPPFPSPAALLEAVADRRAEFQRLLGSPEQLVQYLARLRAHDAAVLAGDDPQARLRAEWWCSEQRLRDEIDPNCRIDHPDGSDYADGPCFTGPFSGPRETQEQVRDLIGKFREAAAKCFPRRSDLNEALVHVNSAIINKPFERWADNWTERHWVAFLYRGGMWVLATVAPAAGRGEWPHAFAMMSGAHEHLSCLETQRLRPKLLLGLKQEALSAKLARAQRAGAEATRRYSEVQRAEWRAMAEASPLASKKSKAAYIQRCLGLPEEAIETIRKAI